MVKFAEMRASDQPRVWSFFVLNLTAKRRNNDFLAFLSQDSAMKRPANETITADGDMVTGVNTKFTELFKDRDKLRFRGKSEQFKVGYEVNVPTERTGMMVNKG